MDGWRALVRLDPSRFADEDIERLLESPMRHLLYGFRDSVLHFTAMNDERVLLMMKAKAEFVPWIEELYERFEMLHQRTGQIHTLNRPGIRGDCFT